MNKRPAIHWPSMAQFTLSLLGILGLGGLSLTLLTIAIFANSIGFLLLNVAQIDALILLSSGLFFGGILLIPSAVHAFGHLQGKEPLWHLPWKHLKWLIFIYPLAIALGFFAASHGALGQYLLPIVHILANGSAVFWLIYQGWRNLPHGSPQRFWGVFNSGLFLASTLSFVTEISIFLLLCLGWWKYIIQYPHLHNQALSLIEQFPQLIASPAIVDRVIREYIFKPGIVWTAFIFIGLLIPLTEELIKSTGVWLLARRKLTPTEGFALGILSGAGYALSENLLLASDAETWAWILLPRLGTMVMHMLASGLTGWGLASAWRDGKYLRLGGAYLASVLLHATWNNLALLISFAQFSGAAEAFGEFGLRIALAAPVGLLILALGAFLGILRANSYFRASSPKSGTSLTI